MGLRRGAAPGNGDRPLRAAAAASSMARHSSAPKPDTVCRANQGGRVRGMPCSGGLFHQVPRKKHIAGPVPETAVHGSSKRLVLHPRDLADGCRQNGRTNAFGAGSDRAGRGQEDVHTLAESAEGGVGPFGGGTDGGRGTKSKGVDASVVRRP